MRIKQSKGFSLIEILIVMLIFGIMATIGSYSYSRYVNNSNLRSWARQVASDITTMKARAITRMDMTYTIYFDKTNNDYILYATTNNDDSSIPGTLYTAEKRPFNNLFGQSMSGITINSLPGGLTNFTLTFLTRGIVSPGPSAIGTCTDPNCNVAAGTCSIILQNSRGSQATITYIITGKTYVTFAMQ
jgi:prepilin-type N-terminal cleavage/methylation domain-containing protein